MKYFPVLFTYVLALLGLCKEHILPKHKGKIVTVFIICLSASALLQFYQEHQAEKEEWQAKWSGRLRSPVETQQKHPVLKLGGTDFVWNGEPTKPIFILAGEPLTVSLVDVRAAFSLVIRDKNGIVLAGVRDNEWFVAPPPVTLDRNFNENSLEVIDPKGEVIFQVEVYGEEIRIAGNFYSVSGVGPITFRPWLAETPSGRLFKYPSSEHPGELATD